MNTRPIDFLLLAILLAGMETSAAADKNIVIDSQLAANSEMLKVKLGTAWVGKTWNFKFGDYSLESSKLGPTVSTSDYSGLGSTTRGASRNEFSFVMGNKTSNSATLNAAFRGATATRSPRDITGVILDRDEVRKNTLEFVATISTANNAEEVWKLTLDYAEGSNVAAKDEGVLTNGSRTFSIIPASSAKDGKDTRKFPALGYEFIEEGVSRCALQYFGGGMLGANKSIIWLGADLDPDMKLVLAATMAAMLQVKIRVE